MVQEVTELDTRSWKVEGGAEQTKERVDKNSGHILLLQVGGKVMTK